VISRFYTLGTPRSHGSMGLRPRGAHHLASQPVEWSEVFALSNDSRFLLRDHNADPGPRGASRVARDAWSRPRQQQTL